jgi:hypothetical protein
LALDFNEAYHTYYEVTKELNDAHFDLNQVLQDAKDGRLQKLDVLKENAQAYVASFVAQHTTLANYRIARAKKDRFLLSGFFAEVGPRLRNSMRLKKDRSFLGKVSLSQLFKAS